MHFKNKAFKTKITINDILSVFFNGYDLEQTNSYLFAFKKGSYFFILI